MKKSAFTEEQITNALRQAEAGAPVAEVCRKLGVSEQTFYRWKRTQVRRHGDGQAPAAAPTGRGAPATQAARGGPDAG